MKLALLGTPEPIKNPVAPSYEIGKLIGSTIGIFIFAASFTAFLFLIIGAIQWLTSGGDKGTLEKARNTIIEAVIGLIIIASIWAIIQFIFPVVGLSFPKITLPSISRGLNPPSP